MQFSIYHVNCNVIQLENYKNSNRARGDRKKKGKDDEVPALMEPELSSKDLRWSWARLIQKIYSVDPLVCPKCQGPMRIITLASRKQLLIPNY